MKKSDRFDLAFYSQTIERMATKIGLPNFAYGNLITTAKYAASAAFACKPSLRVDDIRAKSDTVYGRRNASTMHRRGY